MRQTKEQVLELVNARHDAIAFDADTHTYTCSGIAFPSVSDIMSPVNGLVYGTWSKRKSRAMDRGTNVHKAIEAYDEMGLETEDETIAPYLAAYKSWLETHPTWEVIANERRVKGIGYCGTIDKLVWDNKYDRVFIVDVKTGDVPHPELWDAQLEFYSEAMRETGCCVSGEIVVQCKSDGTFHEHIKDYGDYGIMDELIAIYHWRRKKGVK